MVDCDVSAANGKLRRREVGIPKGVIGLIFNVDVEGPEEGLVGDVVRGFGLDDG